MTNKTKNQDSKLTVYELGYLLVPSLTEDQVADKADQLGKFVSQGSGEVISNGEPKMLKLAYEMTVKHEGSSSDYERAYFGWVKFELAPDEIEDLEQTIKADKEVIRYLLIKTTREDTLAHLADVEEDIEDAELEIDEEDVLGEDDIDEDSDITGDDA